MEINILFVIVAAIIAVGVVKGWKKGFLDGIIRMISGILGILVITVVAKGVGSFLQGRYTNVLVAVILLLSVRILYKIVRFLIDTFKLVRSVPLGRTADRLTGAALGAVGAVFVIWALFLLAGSFETSQLSIWVMEQVGESRFLSLLYGSNYLVELLRQVI